MKQLSLLRFACLSIASIAPLAGAAESVEYTIDPLKSVLKISGDFAGAPLVPQAHGTDSVGYFREFNGERDGNSLKLRASHPTSLFQSVPLLPGREDGDRDISYGLKAQSPTLGQVLISTTRLTFYFSTEYREPLDVSHGTFPASDAGFFLSDGALYYSLADGQRHYVDLHGKGAPNRATSPGTLTRDGNLETLTIPVATTFSVPTGVGDVTLSFSGQMVASRILPAAVIPGEFPDLFGLSVSTDSDHLLVGAPLADAGKGAVHLLYRGEVGFSAWREHMLLRPTHPTATQMFGTAIALGHNAAAIACYHTPVFVFEREPFSFNWTQTAALDVPDDTSFAGGNNMSMSEGMLAIGVNTAGSSEEGAVLIYRRDPSRAWHFVRRLQASDAEPGALFGSSVALLGPYLAVGAPGLANGSGAVYVFKRDEADPAVWHQLQKILPPDPIPHGEFGSSVATNIGQIIISEPGDGQTADTAGRVFIYELPLTGVGDWELKHELIPAEPLPEKSRFGNRVSIDGNNRDVVVTQFRGGATIDTQQPGSAYIFTLTLHGWRQRAKLTSPVGTPGSFGVSQAAGSVHAVVGDYGTTTRPGAAYVYDLTLALAPPVFLEAPGDLRVNAPPGENAEVTVEVTVGDEDGTDLDVRWIIDGEQVESDFVDGSNPFTRGTASLTTTLAPGVHSVRVIADERGSSLETEHTFTITVGEDEEPASLVVTAKPSIIPAQGGRFVLVRLDVQSSRPGEEISWRITRVESSESAGRRPRPDWIIAPNKHSVRLRATTDKRKQDRTYTVHVEARGSAGNVITGSTTVTIVAERNRPGGGR